MQNLQPMGTVTGTGAFRLVLLDELAVLALCRKSVSAPSDWVEPGVGETLASWVAPLSPIDATPAGSIALKLLVPHQRRHQFDGFRALLVGITTSALGTLAASNFSPWACLLITTTRRQQCASRGLMPSSTALMCIHSATIGYCQWPKRHSPRTRICPWQGELIGMGPSEVLYQLLRSNSA